MINIPYIMSEEENRINNILRSNNSELINSFNQDRINPDHEDYNYIYARSENEAGYGKICDQLDMLYWDKINNTDNWTQHITAIKNKFPKPSE